MYINTGICTPTMQNWWNKSWRILSTSRHFTYKIVHSTNELWQLYINLAFNFTNASKSNWVIFSFYSVVLKSHEIFVTGHQATNKKINIFFNLDNKIRVNPLGLERFLKTMLWFSESENDQNVSVIESENKQTDQKVEMYKYRPSRV